MAAPKQRSNRTRWIIGAVVVVVVLVVGGPYVYFHFIEGKAPAKLSLTPSSDPAGSGSSGGVTVPSSSLDGTWKIGSGSTAGYRVKETLFGQSHTAVGRTSTVTGSMTIAGTSVTKGSFTVDMTSITSTGNGSGLRDQQFQGRIMDTSDFPTSTFTLTSPIALGTLPKTGAVKSYSAAGKLTLHGATKSVTIPLTAKETGSAIEVQGILPVTFADYNIDNPSGGPASVGSNGQMEFLVNLTKS